MPEICANGIAAAGRIFIQDGPACLAVLEKRWHIAIRKQDKPIFSSPPAGSFFLFSLHLPFFSETLTIPIGMEISFKITKNIFSPHNFS